MRWRQEGAEGFHMQEKPTKHEHNREREMMQRSHEFTCKYSNICRLLLTRS
jgi:hypothetical protein